MPDALELPGVLRAVVPLVRGEGFAGVRRRVVDELVALAGRHAVRRLRHSTPGRLPRLAAVARALDDLSEPPARLRRVDAVGIGGGSLHVINLPAREVRTAHVPLLALAVCCQDEGSLSRADQYPYTAHDPLLSCRAPSRGLEPHLTNLALPFPPWPVLLVQPHESPRSLERLFSRLRLEDRKSTRLNSSHGYISYAVFCLKKKK